MQIYDYDKDGEDALASSLKYEIYKFINKRPKFKRYN